MVELTPEKGSITAQYLNASNAHLQDAAPASRPWLRRATRVDGALTSASQEERLSRIEAMLQTYGQAMQSLTQNVQELWDHLMGPLDVRDYGIHSSHFSQGKMSPSTRGSLSARGSPRGRASLRARGTPGRGSVKPTPRRRSHS
jgi:hypothetical protein